MKLIVVLLFGGIMALALEIVFFTSPQNPRRVSPEEAEAFASWRRVAPNCSVVVLGGFGDWEHQSSWIKTDAEVDTNFVGRPILGSTLKRLEDVAKNSDALFMLLRSDAVLHETMFDPIAMLDSNWKNWMAVGTRWRCFGTESREISPFQMQVSQLRKISTINPSETIDWMLWNNPKRALLQRKSLPPLSLHTDITNNWIVHEIVSEQRRSVIDASDIMIALDIASGRNEKALAKASYTFRLLRNWESFSNVHLAIRHGSYRFGEGTVLHCYWKLSQCKDRPCISHRNRPGICPCEYSNYWRQTLNDPYTRKGERICGINPQSMMKETELSFDSSVMLGDFHSPVSVLSKVKKDQQVLLSFAGSKDRENVMQFLCTMKELGYRNVVIATSTRKVYKFLHLRGVAVFFLASDASKRHCLGRKSKSPECESFMRDLKLNICEIALKHVDSIIWHDIATLADLRPLVGVSTDQVRILKTMGAGAFPLLFIANRDGLDHLKTCLSDRIRNCHEFNSPIAEPLKTLSKWDRHLQTCI